MSTFHSITGPLHITQMASYLTVFTEDFVSVRPSFYILLSWPFVLLSLLFVLGRPSLYIYIYIYITDLDICPVSADDFVRDPAFTYYSPGILSCCLCWSPHVSETQPLFITHLAICSVVFADDVVWVRPSLYIYYSPGQSFNCVH